MSIKTIPQKYEYKCDSCGAIEPTRSKSPPKYWGKLTLEQDAYDYQGVAIADGTVTIDLCRECKETIVSKINEIKPRLV